MQKELRNLFGKEEQDSEKASLQLKIFVAFPGPQDTGCAAWPGIGAFQDLATPPVSAALSPPVFVTPTAMHPTDFMYLGALSASLLTRAQFFFFSCAVA